MTKYAIYARKSSESEDRQVLSIDSQLDELRQLARSQTLTVDTVLSESRSAKAPGRPIFGQLLKNVSKGAVSGLVCWKLDRLARNPVDGAALIWAMEEGRLQEIVTPGRTFTNSGNDKFWLQMEFGIAKKYVDDLSENVKRGNRAKLGQGWLPGPAPIGYLNDRAKKTIIPDPKRFELVRRMWAMVLDGMPVPKVLEIATKEWGLRTPPMGRHGGTRLTRSSFYRLLSSPFYHGLIVRKGEVYPGSHKPMLSQAEYDRVQVLLGRPNRPPKPKRRFDFTGLIRCGACGLMVTAEKKTNRYGSHYVYYHCSRRRREVICRQPSVLDRQLEEQILEVLGRIQIPLDYLKWTHKRVEIERKDKIQAQDKIRLSLEGGLSRVEQRLSGLLDLRLDQSISESEFVAKKNALTTEKLHLRDNLAKLKENPENAIELSQNAYFLAYLAHSRFQKGDPEDRRYILDTVGSNLSLEDKILLVQLKKPFQLLAETASRNDWLATWDRVRTFFEQNPTAIRFPKWCRKIIRKTDRDKGGRT